MSDYCKFHIWKKSSNNIGKPIMKCRKCKKELKIKNLTVKMEKSNSILQNQNEGNRLKFNKDSSYENMKIEFGEKKKRVTTIKTVKTPYRNCYHYIAWESHRRWKEWGEREKERKGKWSRYDYTNTTSFPTKPRYVDTKNLPFLLSDPDRIDDDYIRITRVPLE